MQKIFILPYTLVLASFFLGSCGSVSNTDTNPPTEQERENKEASQTQENETMKEQSIIKGNDAKSKTIENMKNAYKGEVTATAKYAAYAQKAEQEGYHEIALLYKAVSIAESIHAGNHKAVLLEGNADVPTIKPEYTVKSTKENLEADIEGEAYEATSMYPEFLKIAEEADNELALVSLTYAMKTEKKHNFMYQNALAALQSNTIKSLPTVFFVCPISGDTYETAAPERSEISMTKRETFIKINTL